MRKNIVKAKLKRGEIPIGMGVVMPDPSLAEMLGSCGFDFLMFDGEHGVLTPQLLENLVRACDSAGVVAVARLRVDSAEAMLPFVETGILGVMFPHVRSAADAAMLVEGAKYGPLGKRGLGNGRMFGWGTATVKDHVREWNEEILTIAMVEDVEGIKALPEIVKVPGLDVCHVASSDFANALGYTGEPDHPAVREAQAKVGKEIKAAGRWLEMASITNTPAEAKRLVALGVDMVLYNAVGFLGKKTRELVADTRTALA